MAIDAERYRQLFEDPADVPFRLAFSPGPRLADVGSAVEALIGFTPRELCSGGVELARLLHPEDLEKLPRSLEHVPRLSTLRLVRKDGRTVWAELRLLVVRDAAGRAAGLEGIARDVTARVSSDAALGESDRRLGALVNAVTAGIVFKGPQGQLVDCNPAADRILGVTRDPETGAVSVDPRLGAIHEDGSPYPFEDWPVMHAIRGGRPASGVMGLTRGESLRWVNINAVPLAHPGEAPYGAAVSLEDVTEQRRAWTEVKRGEGQLRLAMECAGHAYWEADLSTLRFVAGAPWTLLGWAGDDLDGTIGAWYGLIHPDDAAGAAALRGAHVDGLTPSYRAEFRVRARDGSFRWILARGRAIARDAAGRALRLAGTLTDVTESKAVESQLRQADRLASVGTLAAGVAHEMNNPLSYVIANLGYVDEGLAAAEQGRAGALAIPDLRAAVREALDGAGRVKGIVGGLRQFAAPPSASDRRRVDPRQQLEAAVSLVRNEVAHRARLRVELPATLPPIVAGEYELAQVLVNLAVNAAQAIGGNPGDNEITITAAAEDGRLVIAVRDTGVGIPQADLPRIFDPFFTTKPVGTGSGLGLSICHGIVASLGGAIEVDSTPSRGTTFRVLLPIAAASPEESVAPPASGARVLVVDDEPLVARSLARLLRGAHEVTTVTSALEALKRARAGEQWDVVLCDVMMPEMSGIELEAALLESRPDLVPRLLYLTGGAFTERSRAFLAERPHLDKPVDATALRAAVAELAKRARAAAAPLARA